MNALMSVPFSNEPVAPVAAIAIRDLQVHASGRCLLHIPQLTIAQGEHVALVGPNGAGKSTLLKVIGGFLTATHGQVSVLGRALPVQGQRTLSAQQWRQLRAATGQVMQGLHLVPRLSALDNVVLGALARPGVMSWWQAWLRLYPEAVRQEAQQALADLGLAHRCSTRADQLSGGERQKVSLARLRLQRPQLVLADEPTSALDPSATQQACQALLAAAHEATLVTVVHQPQLLQQLARRVIGLQSGRMVFDLPEHQLTPALLEALYNNPAPTGSALPDPCQPSTPASAPVGAAAPVAATADSRRAAGGAASTPVPTMAPHERWHHA